MRSDHISALFGINTDKDKEEQYSKLKNDIKKADWTKWRLTTDTQYKTCTNSRQNDESIDVMHESFIEIYHNCMEETLDKVHHGKRRSIAPWVDEAVKEAKTRLNISKIYICDERQHQT